jgi:hypothetical protein
LQIFLFLFFFNWLHSSLWALASCTNSLQA